MSEGKIRRVHTAEFKAKAGLLAVRGGGACKTNSKPDHCDRAFLSHDRTTSDTACKLYFNITT
jgi:hypothetical protein